MKLKDQVAIVTGAGRNIGEEIAKLFAAEGAKVAVVDLDRPRGERVVRCRSRPPAARPSCSSPTSAEGGDVAALVKAVVDRFGRIDILVNNVAISDNKHIFDITEEDWDRVLAVTLKSQFLMGKHVGAADGGAGHRRARSSMSARPPGSQGAAARVAYSAAKGGVANLTARMAVQLAPHKIRVNAIVPNKIGSPVGKDEFDPARPVPNMAKRAGPAGGGRQGRAVPGERRFLVHLRRQSVRRRRRLGDGFVVVRARTTRALQHCRSQSRLGLEHLRERLGRIGEIGRRHRMRRSISRRTMAMSRCALMPTA